MNRLTFSVAILLSLSACAVDPAAQDSSSPSPTESAQKSGTVSTPSPTVAPLLDGPDWMANSASSGIGSKAINAISIPATHDSGTYGIESVYNRPVDDVFAPDDGQNGTIRLGEFVGVSDGWAKAQDKTIGEQLADGIRAIDLRPCTEKNGTLRVCHSLYGAKMADILADVASFADAHPKEFILVNMQTFAGHDSNHKMSDADHQALLSMIDTKIGTHVLDASKGEVSPTTTLDDVWKTGKSIAIVYDDARRSPKFLSADSVTNSWKDVWNRTDKRTSLEGFLQTTPSSKFFWFAGQATPGTDLIEYSLDPLGNYPTNLHKLADATNPVVLGWVKNEWSKMATNVIAVDFYESSCVVPLTAWLNGATNVSFDGCNIGSDTMWGKWSVGPYGRGAGVPMVCASGEEEIAGLCYTQCQSGYTSPALFPTVCAQPCPSGYRDDGLTCFRDAQIISADNSSCPWYDVCGLTFAKGCSTCPSGFSNDGCTCRIDPNMIVKQRYDRGVGKPLDACPSGTEQSGLLCYPTCKPGYHGVGPMCWPNY